MYFALPLSPHIKQVLMASFVLVDRGFKACNLEDTFISNSQKGKTVQANYRAFRISVLDPKNVDTSDNSK